MNTIAESTPSFNSAHVADVVAYYWQQTGAGPTWRELAEEMEWPAGWTAEEKVARERIIRSLAKAGWLKFTNKQARSLRPGDRNAEAYRRYQHWKKVHKQARKEASRVS